MCKGTLTVHIRMVQVVCLYDGTVVFDYVDCRQKVLELYELLPSPKEFTRVHAQGHFDQHIHMVYIICMYHYMFILVWSILHVGRRSGVE